MWNRPDILNGISGVFIVASVLLAAYGGVILFANLSLFPVRQINVSSALEPAGELHHVTREQIEEVVGTRLEGTFFTVNLEAARAAFASLPWVRNVEVRRTWPDRLEVTIEEQAAFANWSGGKVVNTHGELFDAGRIDGLPEFSGPPGSESEVTRHYRDFSAPLKKLGLTARQIALSPRLAWELKLDNGLALKLGRDLPRDPLTGRIERFVAAYADTVTRVSGRLEVADLRYTQGFTLRLPPGASLAAVSARAAATGKDTVPTDRNKRGQAAVKGKA